MTDIISGLQQKQTCQTERCVFFTSPCLICSEIQTLSVIDHFTYYWIINGIYSEGVLNTSQLGASSSRLLLQSGTVCGRLAEVRESVSGQSVPRTKDEGPIFKVTSLEERVGRSTGRGPHCGEVHSCLRLMVDLRGSCPASALHCFHPAFHTAPQKQHSHSQWVTCNQMSNQSSTLSSMCFHQFDAGSILCVKSSPPSLCFVKLIHVLMFCSLLSWDSVYSYWRNNICCFRPWGMHVLLWLRSGYGVMLLVLFMLLGVL